MTFLQCATAVASTADSLCTAYLLESVGEVYYELHIESHDTPQIGPTSVLFLSTPVFCSRGWASEKFRFFGDTWLYGVGSDLVLRSSLCTLSVSFAQVSRVR